MGTAHLLAEQVLLHCHEILAASALKCDRRHVSLSQNGKDNLPRWFNQLGRARTSQWLPNKVGLRVPSPSDRERSPTRGRECAWLILSHLSLRREFLPELFH